MSGPGPGALRPLVHSPSLDHGYLAFARASCTFYSLASICLLCLVYANSLYFTPVTSRNTSLISAVISGNCLGKGVPLGLLLKAQKMLSWK